MKLKKSRLKAERK